MAGVLQAAAIVLLSAVLGVFLAGQGKEITILLSLMACCMIFVLLADYIRPIMDFIRMLRQLGNLNSQMTEILLKAAGIGLISEITMSICGDAGNSALGKALQLLTGMAILWLSIPLMTTLLELLQKIMGEL